MQTILLTGATGFLGSHLLKKILTATNHNIIVLKRSFSDCNRIIDVIENSRIKTYDIDFTDLKTIFEENKIDAIIHCATSYGRDGNCAKVLSANLIFPVQILELAILHNVDLFINTDSYFNKENMSYLYLQDYSLSKKSLLIWLKYFSQKIKIINVILEHIYGPFDSKNKFIANMVEQIVFQQVESIKVTPGEQQRDFIYIDDVTNAYIKILDYGLKNNFRYRDFNLGSGKATKIRDFLNQILEISKSKTNIIYGGLPYRDDEIMISVADIIELNNLNWSPQYSLREGLKETIRLEELARNGK